MNKQEKNAFKKEIVDLRLQTRSLPNKSSRNELLLSLQQIENSVVAGGKFESNLTLEEAEIFHRLSGLVLHVVQVTNNAPKIVK